MSLIYIYFFLLFLNCATGRLKKKRATASDKTSEAWSSIKTSGQRGTGDNREHKLRGSTQWLTLPASCHPMRRRLRLSNCLPRWAPTGSLPGCSHAKWLQMTGMIRCWLRPEQNLPGNLATCSSKSQWLSARTDQSHCAHICARFWTSFCWNIHAWTN